MELRFILQDISIQFNNEKQSALSIYNKRLCLRHAHHQNMIKYFGLEVWGQPQFFYFLVLVLMLMCLSLTATYLNNNQYQHLEIMIKTFVLLSLLAFFSTHCLYFGITGKPFCFDIDEEPGKTIKFFYEVTGEKPEETQVHIVSANQNTAISLSGSNNKTEQPGDSSLNVCFVSTDGGYKSVSVDFYTHDKAHLLELAKKSQIYELHTKLIDVGEGLKQISKNEHFEEQRQKIHAEIITEHENKVKNFAVIKLLAIVVVAVGQLYLLKKMLDKQGQGYQPV